MNNKTTNSIILLFPLFIAILLLIIFSVRIGFLFYGLFNLGMYIHITTTTLTNALLGRDIDSKADAFWKLLLLFISTLSFALFFAL